MNILVSECLLSATRLPCKQVCLLIGFLTLPSTTRLYRGRALRQSVLQFHVLPHMRQSWENMTSVSAGHNLLTPTQPVGSGQPQRESNPGPAPQQLRALLTELQHPPCKQVLGHISQFLHATRERERMMRS